MIKITTRKPTALWGIGSWLQEAKNDEGVIWHRIGYARTASGYVGIHLDEGTGLRTGTQHITFEAIRGGRQVVQHQKRTGTDRVTPRGALLMARRWGAKLARGRR